MRLAKLFLALGLGATLGFASFWFLPPHWLRKAGVLDLVVLVDRSVSNSESLPRAVAGARRLLHAVFPGDRVAVFTVGPEVNVFALGPMSSRAALSVLDRQVATLRPAAHGGTLLGEGFSRVRAAFDTFLRNQSGEHRRVLVIFSDCIDASFEPADFSSLALPGQTSVLVVGFRGENKDVVTRALMGLDGSNDVHIVPPADTEAAITSLLNSIRKCHPVRVSAVLLVVALCLLVGMLMSLGVFAVGRRPATTLSVRLQKDSDESSAQIFILPDGASISIGGGEQIHDFPVPVDGNCTVTRAGRVFSLLPGAGQLLLQRSGTPVPVDGPCAISLGETFVLEGAAVTIQQA